MATLKQTEDQLNYRQRVLDAWRELGFIEGMTGFDGLLLVRPPDGTRGITLVLWRDAAHRKFWRTSFPTMYDWLVSGDPFVVAEDHRLYIKLYMPKGGHD